MYTITTIDEYGYSYHAATLYNREAAEFYLSSLYDALEDASVSQSYAIKEAIAELEEQLD